MLIKKESQQGQTMIEIVFAIGASALCLIALTTAVVKALGSINFAKTSSEANKRAQKKIETARVYRDNGNNFGGWDEDGTETCYGNITESNLEYVFSDCSDTSFSDISGTPFSRQIKIENFEANKKRVTVTIRWGEDDHPHQAEATTILSKWQKHQP